MDTFGKRLKALRERLGRTVDDMAHIVGVQRQAWHSWERNAFMPSADRLVSIARVTGASLDWLLLGKGEGP